MRILYIEDNPHDAGLVRHALARVKPAVELDIATTLAQARAALAASVPYDVVLTDLHLPDGQGIDFVRELRAQALPVAVVALTGQGDETLVLQCLKAGADDYLAKADGFAERLPSTLQAAVARFRADRQRHQRILRVLYGERNAIDVDLTRRHLEQHAPHIRLDAVPDAAAVLASLPHSGREPCDWDLLLLDYRLAGDSGLDVLKQVREDRGLDLPVVVVTGQGNEDVAALAMRLGATDYVVKRDAYLLALPALLETAFHRVLAAREKDALQRSEARLALVLRGSSDASWDLDLVGGEHYLSVNLWQMLGREVPATHVDLAALRGLLHPDEQAALGQHFQAAIDGSGESIETELQLLHRSGHYVPLLARGYITRDSGGRAVRVSGTCTDLSERKRAEATIRDLNASLERRVAERTAELHAAKAAADAANQSKSEFLARMSHDLRTPLNAVLGFAQLLSIDDVLRASPAAAQKVEHIHAAGTHLLELIDDVLDLARIESGALRLSLESVDVQDLLADCLTLVAPLAAQHRVSTVCAPRSGRLLARGDRIRLRQVLVNLLTNAIKYNRSGGRVEVEFEGTTEEVEIRIHDTGIGMSEAQITELFQPFNRLGAERSGIEGTGLGLVIAKQLVDSMQGRLQAQSGPGQGSTFTLRLPHGTDEPAAPVAAPASSFAHGTPAASATAQLVVLYVEDNPVNVLLMKAMLATRPNVRLEIAVDGPGGLAAAQQLRPDLVLLDINLPGLSGYEVLGRLKEDPATATLRCVAVSANALESETARALQAGFADYITKPFTIERLLRFVDDAG